MALSPTSSGKGSAGSGTTTPVFSSTLGADTASIDTGAGGIPGTGSILEVLIIARTDEAGAQVNVNVTVNNDVVGPYDRQPVIGSNGAQSSAVALNTTAWAITAHGSGGTGGYPAVIRIVIPGYALATFPKVAELATAVVDTTAANNLIAEQALGYRPTTAISRIAVAGQAAAKLKTGSSMFCYVR